MKNSNTPHAYSQLEVWFKQNARPLPWRAESCGPYEIWLSEVMLQQSTVASVKGYYARFLKALPHVAALAQASEERVLGLWSGLGYYSRARNLHAAAKMLVQVGWPASGPRSYKELIVYSGFGEYTSRSVSSLAFGEPVGVLDTNVIRVLCRYYNSPLEYWRSSARRQLQAKADAWAQKGAPQIINQALMELGALVCLPKKPLCSVCPIANRCKALKAGTVEGVLLQKPRREKELWALDFYVWVQDGKLAVVPNKEAPFLKGSLMPCFKAKKLSKPPSSWDVRHFITHHSIFVRVHKGQPGAAPPGARYVTMKQLRGLNPSSLLVKALAKLKTSPNTSCL